MIYLLTGAISQLSYLLVCDVIHIFLWPTGANSMGEWVSPFEPLANLGVSDGILPFHKEHTYKQIISLQWQNNMAMCDFRDQKEFGF